MDTAVLKSQNKTKGQKMYTFFKKFWKQNLKELIEKERKERERYSVFAKWRYVKLIPFCRVSASNKRNRSQWRMKRRIGAAADKDSLKGQKLDATKSPLAHISNFLSRRFSPVLSRDVRASLAAC